MATELILVRHGHAVRIKGNYVRAPLTELGRKQAALTGQHFCNLREHLDGFYCSPLRRAKETASLIGTRVGQFPKIRKGIQELEGMETPQLIFLELLAHWGFFGSFLYDNAGRAYPWPIIGRVSTVLTELIARHPNQRLVVVTHSGVISSVLAWYFPNRRRHWWRYTVGNCSLTRFRIEPSGKAELLGVNETKHLFAELVTAQPPAPAVEAAKQVEQTVEQVVPKTPATPSG